MVSALSRSHVTTISKLSWTISLTFVAWLLGIILYSYYWVTSTLAEPGLGGYKREPLLHGLSLRFIDFLIW
jgi:hypothetical protein